VPAGAEASGRVVEAVPQGRFKGAAVLRLVLESVTVNGEARDVKTGPVSRSLKGKGKRTATLIGGGSGAGALIGVSPAAAKEPSSVQRRVRVPEPQERHTPGTKRSSCLPNQS
jgi:hypothetical protein